MDTGKYTYKALCDKYGDFRGPSFTIKIDGTALDSGKIPVVSLSVDLSADGSAGGCHFEVECLYDYEKSAWYNGLEDKIKVGAKLEISCGYVKQEEIFFGYVDEYAMQQQGSSVPRLVVAGIDGMGFLMSCQQPVYGGKKQAKKVVEEIFDKAISAGYAKKKQVGALSGFTTPLIKERIDDFKFLRMLAERYCVSLLCVDGELIFDSLSKNATPLISLSNDSGLLRFKKQMSLRGQVGKVEVWGRDVNEAFIKGTADKVSIGGSGKTACDLATGFKNAVMRLYSEFVRTEEECVKLAQAKLDSVAINFVSGEGVCVGIPEIIPGRYIELKGVDDDMAGTYYITKVRHMISTRGFYTTFHVKGARVV